MIKFPLTPCLSTVTALVLAAGTAGAQSGSREAPAEDMAAANIDARWQVPRTSWGHPSLEGTWSTDDMRSVPRQRPFEFGERDTLSTDEFAARAAADDDTRNFHVNEQGFSRRGEAGTRTFGYSSLIIDPSDGRMPAMTETGLGRAAPSDRGSFGPGPFDSLDDFTLYDRCIMRGILGSQFPVVYGNGLRIVQTVDAVAISYEMIHDTRVILLGNRPRMDEGVRQYLGNSRGYWDGDSLVVATRNLTDRTSIGGNGNGTRHSEAMTITERFTRVDPEMIEYIATVEDPITYEAPFTVRMMYTTQPGYSIYEYSCHEGNGAVSHSLTGERAYEQRVAQAIANGDPIPERVTPIHEETYIEDPDAIEFFDINAGE